MYKNIITCKIIHTSLGSLYSFWAKAATEKEGRNQWRMQCAAKSTLFKTLPYSNPPSLSSEPFPLLLLHLLPMPLPKLLRNQSEERRKTFSK